MEESKMSNNLPMLSSLKNILKREDIIERFVGMLGKAEAKVFSASIINITSGSSALQKCTEKSIMMAAFKSAALKLPIDPALGRAYIIPYGSVATFQLGYKGLRELAIRSRLYEKIKTAEIYEDDLKSYDPITGDIEFTDLETRKDREDPKKDPIGYYAFFIMNTGFKANVYMSKKEVENHGKKFSQAYKKGKKDCPWFTDFDKMACKTVLKRLLNDNGILSIEMQTGMVGDSKEEPIEVQDAVVTERPEAPKVEKKAPKPKDKDVIDNPHEPVKEPVHGKVEPEPPKEKDPFD